MFLFFYFFDNMQFIEQKTRNKGGILLTSCKQSEGKISGIKKKKKKKELEPKANSVAVWAAEL